jgi:hypothetical protein
MRIARFLFWAAPFRYDLCLCYLLWCQSHAYTFTRVLLADTMIHNDACNGAGVLMAILGTSTISILPRKGSVKWLDPCS